MLCTPEHRIFITVLTAMLCALLLPTLPLSAVDAFGLGPSNVLQDQHQHQVGLLMLLLEARCPVASAYMHPHVRHLQPRPA
jgi:hypothetical protein